MNNWLRNLKKTYKLATYILSPKYYWMLQFIILLIAIFEFLGLGSVALIISYMLDENANDLGFLKYFSNFTEIVSQNFQFSTVAIMGFLILFVFFIKATISMLGYFYIKKYILAFELSIKTKIFGQFTSLKFESFLNKKFPESNTLINENVPITSRQIECVLTITKEIIMSSFIVFALYTLNPNLIFLLIIIISIFSIFYYALFSSKLLMYGKQFTEGNTEAVSAFRYLFEGIKEIKIFNKESFFKNNFVSGYKKVNKSTLFRVMINVAPRFLFEFLTIFLCIILIVISINYFNIDKDKILLLSGIYFLAALRVIPSAKEILMQFNQMRFGLDSLNRVYSVVFPANEIQNSFEKYNKKINGDFEKLTFKNVFFRYKNSNKNVLNNINLDIQKKDIVGITGESGIGKTTLFNIICGFVEPASGEILVNNEINLKNYNIRSKISYLPQEVFLLKSSILENVTLEKDENKIDLKKVESALKKANIYDFVMNLPDRLETDIKEGGLNLSGGQRHRIAIARAFYFEREVLLMDEPTKELDEKTEKEIFDDLIKNKNDKTFIIISHKASTLNYCNKIYKITNDGKLINGGI